MVIMKIFSWNVNGLRSVIKKGELSKFIERYQPDIVCIQETKSRRGQVNIDLPEYQQFWNSADKAGYAGTAMLVRRGLSDLIVRNSALDLPARLADRYHLSDDKFGDANTEGRVLMIELDKIILVTVYTPNSKRDLSRLELRSNAWDPAFRDYIRELAQHKPVIICGDLNVAASAIDLANPQANEGHHGFTVQERNGFQNLLAVGLTDSFRAIHGQATGAYTWWTPWAQARQRNIGWRIDYFLVDNRLTGNLQDASIQASQMGSDHCPVSVTMEF
jgi:exodeoxyribonuclease-3